MIDTYTISLVISGSVIGGLITLLGWILTVGKKFQLLDDLVKAFDKLDAKFDKIDQQFNKIDARFDKIDARFDKIDARFDKIDARFEKLETKVGQLTNATVEIQTVLKTQSIELRHDDLS